MLIVVNRPISILKQWHCPVHEKIGVLASDTGFRDGSRLCKCPLSEADSGCQRGVPVVLLHHLVLLSTDRLTTSFCRCLLAGTFCCVSRSLKSRCGRAVPFGSRTFEGARQNISVGGAHDVGPQ